MVTSVPDRCPQAQKGSEPPARGRWSTTFSRVFGFDESRRLPKPRSSRDPSSGECVADDDGCVLLPVTFPVQVVAVRRVRQPHARVLDRRTACRAPTRAIEYWPIVGAESLPGSATFAAATRRKMAILPLCKGAGWSVGSVRMA